MTDERTLGLIDYLLNLPAETSWVEFKCNHADPMMIGKLISALSNSARFANQNFAYVLWGVQENKVHSVAGTTFEPSSQTMQKEPLEFWLTKRLQPSILFTFESVDYQGARLVLLKVPAAAKSPVEFDRTAYIRIGSATPRLSDHLDYLRALWKKLISSSWETEIAAPFLTEVEVLDRLDYPSYFKLTNLSQPNNQDGIIDKLVADRLVEGDVDRHWNVTNLGAILFAKRLADFSPSIERKAIRFVTYGGRNRADEMTHSKDIPQGYASGFEDLISHIGMVFRKTKSPYPLIAIRELIANALIHQDMTITGTGPLIEMFQDRLRITNPGRPLVKPERFLDSPPRSRNEALASLMRRMGMCKELGTGIDKVISAVEGHRLLPPDFRTADDAFHVVLSAPR